MYAMQIVRFQSNGSVLCHRWDVNARKLPIKQTDFGGQYSIYYLNPLPLGAIGEITSHPDDGHFSGTAFDIFGAGQLELF